MTTRPHNIHLPLEAMLRLRQRVGELAPAIRDPGHWHGDSPRLSAFRGRGMAFDEVRSYQPGDEARHIDWRVTARRGEPYTKLFREERQRPVFIVIDFHGGMYFGSRRVFKSVLASELATMAAWAAQINGDRIGGLIDDGERIETSPPKRREAGVLPLLHSIERLQPRAPNEPDTGRLDALLHRATQLASPGSLIVLLSDFLQAGAAFENHLRALRPHHELRIGFISDPLEQTPPRCGRLSVGTPAGGCHRIDTGSAKLRRRWKTLFDDRWQKLASICRQQRIRLHHCRTDDEPLTTLQRLL